MKKGFALLETIIVITFLSVSLLLLYGTFSSLINNSKKNIFYDDASNIYKAYYMKEYLQERGLNNLLEDNIKEITCGDFFGDCEELVNEYHINNMYIAKTDLKTYDEEKYSSSLINYLSSLSNKSKYEYRLVLEFLENDLYYYASIGINGDDNE